MNILELDRILLTTFLSVLAILITTAISLVKMVNDKEKNTSEFRQEWINSVRKCISDLAAKIVALTASQEYQARLIDKKEYLEQEHAHEKEHGLITETIKRVDEEYTTHRHDLHQSYALLKLHFKPNDADFQPIEEIFNLITNNNKRMAEVDNNIATRMLIRNENNDYAKNIIEIGRKILKTEWERVKDGEKVYKNIRKFAVWGSWVMLVILIVLGGVYASKTAENNKHDAQTSSRKELKIDARECWKFQSFKERFYKMNTCTGELIEINIENNQNEKKLSLSNREYKAA